MKECTELKLNEEKFQDQLETQRMDMEKNQEDMNSIKDGMIEEITANMNEKAQQIVELNKQLEEVTGQLETLKKGGAQVVVVEKVEEVKQDAQPGAEGGGEKDENAPVPDDAKKEDKGEEEKKDDKSAHSDDDEGEQGEDEQDEDNFTGVWREDARGKGNDEDKIPEDTHNRDKMLKLEFENKKKLAMFKQPESTMREEDEESEDDMVPNDPMLECQMHNIKVNYIGF